LAFVAASSAFSQGKNFTETYREFAESKARKVEINEMPIADWCFMVVDSLKKIMNDSVGYENCCNFQPFEDFANNIGYVTMFTDTLGADTEQFFNDLIKERKEFLSLSNDKVRVYLLGAGFDEQNESLTELILAGFIPNGVFAFDATFENAINKVKFANIDQNISIDADGLKMNFYGVLMTLAIGDHKIEINFTYNTPNEDEEIK